MSPVFERAKTFHALDRAAIVIGNWQSGATKSRTHANMNWRELSPYLRFYCDLSLITKEFVCFLAVV
jgi:hypothetical protein